MSTLKNWLLQHSKWKTSQGSIRYDSTFICYYGAQKKIEITPDLAAKLRFYDSADLSAIIKEHNDEKRQILEQNAVLLSLLEETDGFKEEQVKALHTHMKSPGFFLPFLVW